MKGVYLVNDPILPNIPKPVKFSPTQNADSYVLLNTITQIESMLLALPRFLHILKQRYLKYQTITPELFELHYYELCKAGLIPCFDDSIPALHRELTKQAPNGEKLGAIKKLNAPTE